MSSAGGAGRDGTDADAFSPVQCDHLCVRHLADYRFRGIVTFVSDEWGTEYMHLFTATGWTGTPHPCDEGELAWIKKAELRGLPMWEGDKIFLRLLEENVPFFSLKLQYQGDRLDRAVLNGIVGYPL